MNTLIEESTNNHADTRGVRIVALVVAHMYAAYALFQVALAMGAPFGESVWGGGNDPVLRTGLRTASAVAAVILIWMMIVVLARAGVVRMQPVKERYLGGFTWAIAGFMALNTLGNLASQSLVEQRVFAPVAAIMTALTVVIAHRGGQDGL